MLRLIARKDPRRTSATPAAATSATYASDGVAWNFQVPHRLTFVRSIGLGGELLCRGLGSRWFTERFHGNALVTHLQDDQVFRAARRVQNHAVARCGLHQRARQGRHPTDVVADEIDLVGADDAHHSLRSCGIGIAHGRSEECPRRRLPRSRTFRVHHFRGIDSLREKANPPIDLAQPPLAVLIVGVLTTIAVTRGPRHHLGHCRSFPGEQKMVLVFEALQAARRDVVLDSRGGLICLRFSRKPFSHTVSPSSANTCGGLLETLNASFTFQASDVNASTLPAVWATLKWDQGLR